VISLTTQTQFDYTEPIPIDPIVHEPQTQVHESEENEERSSFAELLAGLLHGPKPAVDSNLDDLSAEKTKDAGKLNIFANAVESDSGEKDLLKLDVFSGLELSDSAVDFEDQSFLSAEHLLNSSLNLNEIAEDSGDISRRLDAALINRLADNAVKTGVSFAAEKSHNDPASQVLASLEANAKKNAEEALALGDKKKNSIGAANREQLASEASSKNEKIDLFSSKNKAGEENAAMFNRREQNTQTASRLEEFRSRSRKDKVSIEVRDMRTAAGIQGSAEARPYALVETSSARMPGQAAVQEITLDLRLPDNGYSSQAQTTWEAKANTALENMLARELHQNFNGDIVRHASMALRDNGVGTIKLALHPETLGNVKIHLELSENKITGRIIVESQEALNAFRKELDSLEQAFKDSGFADASLDLSLTSDGEKTRQEREDSSFTPQMAASSYENGSLDSEEAPIIDVIFGRRAGSINMLA